MSMTQRRQLFKAVLTAALGLGAQTALAELPRFAEDGSLLLPQDYRRWVMVGTQVTPNELNDGNAPFTETRVVYINPEGFDHWLANGSFPDGTMMAKELLSIGAREGVGSGNGYFMGDFYGLEVSVKSREHFPDQPGNWGYYIFYLPGQPVPAAARHEATETCNACHAAGARDDFVFTQFYPVLRAAQGTGVRGIRPSN